MILIAMAGKSSRFFAQGYTQPKYELLVGDKTLFQLSVESFASCFHSEHFVFVTRAEFSARKFIERECQKMGVDSFSVVDLEYDTAGQAESVFLGLRDASDDAPLTIFNIDTIRHHFVQPNLLNCDGYLDVFEGDGSNWSFAKCAPGSKRVIETAEKIAISNLCSTGLYFYKTVGLYRQAYDLVMRERSNYVSRWKELYIAPMYNELIAQGCNIQVNICPREDVLFSGTPEEYQQLLAQVKV